MKKKTEDYPFTLILGPTLFHLGTLTYRSKDLDHLEPPCYAEVHPEDARELQVNQGDKIRIWSDVGELIALVKLSSRQEKGVIFMPDHLEACRVNRLFGHEGATTSVNVVKLIEY
jgi:anaerobic selenocysteine-containing dehydrogenase